MADFPVSGAASYIQFGWEAVAYGTEASTIDKAFGHDQKITVNRNSNLSRVYGLGSPYASKITAGRFEGSLTIDFILASSYFMKAVMGTVSDGGATPYTHTYTHNTGYVVTSFTVENGWNLDTEQVFKYLGCVVDSCEITAAVGEPARVTLNVLYGKETKATSGIDATPATDSELPLIFSEGSLDLPSGTTIARVQSFTLTIGKEAEIIYGLGSRIATAAIWRRTSYDFRLTTTVENANFLEDEYGQATGPLTATIPAGEASLVLTFTNGGAAAAKRSLVITLTTTYVTSDSVPQDVATTMMADYTGYSLGHTSIVGSDNTETTP